MTHETFIIGTSEATEAEYGNRCDTSPVTVIGLCDGEIFTVYGASSIKAAKAELISDGVATSQISCL